ncbi:MAG TPA: hypothetical protein VF161_03505 [Steroidobacteraceae bacterium]|jgi:hypothetical protein
MALDERDPRYHTRNVRQQLAALIDHLHEDIEKVDEPQLKSLFEASADVLSGLTRALSEYERRYERARGA